MYCFEKLNVFLFHYYYMLTTVICCIGPISTIGDSSYCTKGSTYRYIYIYLQQRFINPLFVITMINLNHIIIELDAQDTGDCKGFAFVEFYSPEHASYFMASFGTFISIILLLQLRLFTYTCISSILCSSQLAQQAILTPRS